MRVAVHTPDKTNFPNVALMKLSAWHKSQGDYVEWFSPLFGKYDKIYSSKVFTFTPYDGYLPEDAIKGGTGYDIKQTLPDYIEHLCPDYSLYNSDYSLGFLTRGCPRKCKWCFVPDKEGGIKAHADIEEWLQHKQAVIMDNNILAHDHGISQLEKIAKLRIKIDVNQGIDARLIDPEMARLLSKQRWMKPIRLACDHKSQMPSIEKAVGLLRAAGATPKAYFCYLLVDDIDDAHERSEFLRSLKVDPFAQPYRSPEGDEPTTEQKRFARWVNHKAIFKTVKWKDYA